MPPFSSWLSVNQSSSDFHLVNRLLSCYFDGQRHQIPRPNGNRPSVTQSLSWPPESHSRLLKLVQESAREIGFGFNTVLQTSNQPLILVYLMSTAKVDISFKIGWTIRRYTHADRMIIMCIHSVFTPKVNAKTNRNAVSLLTLTVTSEWTNYKLTNKVTKLTLLIYWLSQ